MLKSIQFFKYLKRLQLKFKFNFESTARNFKRSESWENFHLAIVTLRRIKECIFNLQDNRIHLQLKSRLV